MRLYDPDAPQRITSAVVLYGPPKWGKTRLALTCPNVFVIECEPDGELSIPGLKKQTGRVEDVDDLDAVLTQYPPVWKKAGFQTIFLDGLTFLTERYMAKTLLLDPSLDGFGKIYGVVGKKMNAIFGKFLALTDFHRVMTFQLDEKDVHDEKGKIIQTNSRPRLPGRDLSVQLAHLTSEIFMCCTKRGTEEKYLLTQAAFDKIAGDRSGALSKMEPPNLGQIFDKIAASSSRTE